MKTNARIVDKIDAIIKLVIAQNYFLVLSLVDLQQN